MVSSSCLAGWIFFEMLKVSHVLEQIWLTFTHVYTIFLQECLIVSLNQLPHFHSKGISKTTHTHTHTHHDVGVIIHT